MSVITNWDDAESLLHHCCYNELRVAPEEHPVMIVLPSSPFTSKSTREKLTQIMFETFSVPAFYIGDSSVLSLIATGKTNGVVVNSGYGNTYIVPVYECVSCPDAALSTDLAGQYLTERLSRQLANLGHSLPGSSMKSILEDIKANGCYVALDYKAELKKTNDKLFKYELPDGNIIEMKNERFSTPEVLFQPSLDGFQDEGLAEMILRSVRKCDPELGKYIFQNIVLAGKTSLLNGYPDRVKKELGLTQDGKHYKVIAPPERGLLPWIGGSMLTALSHFEESWITKDEYDEEGPTIINKKCY
ncbi:actin [Oopsacas minuta]|uniref:Actin n=1 Tax=Oopsacas minuta TaxID=111878 RepID=A0AAV7KI79_9METZ|nr:actin [Oopsacas minuta]